VAQFEKLFELFTPDMVEAFVGTQEFPLNALKMKADIAGIDVDWQAITDILKLFLGFQLGKKLAVEFGLEWKICMELLDELTFPDIQAALKGELGPFVKLVEAKGQISALLPRFRSHLALNVFMPTFKLDKATALKFAVQLPDPLIPKLVLEGVLPHLPSLDISGDVEVKGKKAGCCSISPDSIKAKILDSAAGFVAGFFGLPVVDVDLKKLKGPQLSALLKGDFVPIFDLGLPEAKLLPKFQDLAFKVVLPNLEADVPTPDIKALVAGLSIPDIKMAFEKQNFFLPLLTATDRVAPPGIPEVELPAIKEKIRIISAEPPAFEPPAMPSFVPKIPPIPCLGKPTPPKMDMPAPNPFRVRIPDLSDFNLPSKPQ
jgi:hypothetical protein